ncbi:MAG: hypothetical protein WA814_06550 [Candidatus Baltobacteraceae bacterium]
MRTLTFASPRCGRIRALRFASRSLLPLGAACVVGAAVRETLASLLGSPVVLRLSEPSIPMERAWAEIMRDAILHRVRGAIADAAIVIRPGDAAALAGAAFGESPTVTASPRRLSTIECAVLERTARAIAANLGAICGATECTPQCDAGGFVTYFELLVEEPVQARIGIALSRDPSPEPRGLLETRHVALVELRALASFDLEPLEAAAIAKLTPGTMLPVSAAAFLRGALRTCGQRVASGTCGVRGGRYAFAVDRTSKTA